MDSLVSIIVPVYNSEKYLERCLNSLSAQSLREIEVIIINDGSTDGSLSLCMKYAKEDSRFKIYSQSNKGPSSARNLGLEKANGKYITFVDSDDYIDENMLEKMFKLACNYNKVLVFCDNFEIWKKKQVHRQLFADKNNVIITKSDAVREIASGNAGLICCKLFSTDIAKEYRIKFDKEAKMCEDQLFFLNISQYAENFLHLKEPLYFYDRRNENSITTKYQINPLENQIYIQERLINYFSYNGFIEAKDKKILDIRFMSIVWHCVSNEIQTCNFFNLLDRYKKVEHVLSYPMVKSLVPEVSSESLIHKILTFGITKNNILVTFLLSFVIIKILLPLKELGKKIRSFRLEIIK